MKSFVFGITGNGLPIPAYEFGTAGPRILILGGVHGNEPEGVILAQALWGDFQVTFPYRLRLTLVPVLNVDGLLAGSRLNGNGVDLNRNLPTRDWNPDAFSPKYPPGPSANSEPENQALTAFLEKNPLQFIFSLHSWNPLLNVNGDCEPVSTILSHWTGYKIEPTIGYPTPGCLGTYCGIERGQPTITFEIERGMVPKEVVRVHLPAMREALKACERLNP